MARRPFLRLKVVLEQDERERMEMNTVMTRHACKRGGGCEGEREERGRVQDLEEVSVKRRRENVYMEKMDYSRKRRLREDFETRAGRKDMS